MDEIKQKFPTLESAFNEFVKSVGGELIGDLLPSNQSVTSKNADYLSRQQNVIAELKCLQKNFYETEEDKERVYKKLETRIRNGPLTEEDVFNEDGALRIFETIKADIKRTLEGVFHQAKKQIKQTKDVLQMPDAKGLLFLANEGNYFYQFSTKIFTDILDELFESDPRSIEGYAFFATNKVTEHKQNVIIWIANSTSKDPAYDKFVDELGRKWSEFVSTKTGANIIAFEDWDERVIEEKLSSLRIIPPQQ